MLNRICLQNPLTRERPSSCLPPLNMVAKSLLLTVGNDDALVSNIKILMSRVLVETLPFFNNAFSDLIVKTIYHKYYSEMSSKSNIVSRLDNVIVFRFL